MRRKMKHFYILQFIFALVLGTILSMSISVSVYAIEKSGTCGETLTWNLSGNILTISGSGDMTDYADGALAPWFGVSGEIQNIILPDELTSIGDYAFFGCKNVTNITIPSTVIEIGECAFAQCKSLLQVDFGSGVEKLGEGAFQECEALIDLTFPASLTEIGTKVFFKCASLPAITVPSTVNVIGESAFSYCTGMMRATINAPITELPGWTFYGCDYLTDVSLSSSIVSAGDYAFLFCENLNGIYTQGGNIETVHALEESIYEKDGAPAEGLVKAHEMPAESNMETDDGKLYIQTKAVQSGNNVILEKRITDYSSGNHMSKMVVEAVIKDTDGWLKAAEIVERALNVNETAELVVYLFGNTVESETLEYFVEKSITLKIVSKTGAIWEIDMSQMNLGSFNGQYILEEMAEDPVSVQEEATATEAEESIPENVTGMTEIPQKELPIFEPYDADSVNADINDLETVDSNPDTSNLTDAEGKTYYISNRSSKWGITLKQFSAYVILWIASAILIVAVIMLTANQRKKSKEQYEELVKQGQAEDAAANDALQLEILKEMLNKK